jgi:hypothetical protein
MSKYILNCSCLILKFITAVLSLLIYIVLDSHIKTFEPANIIITLRNFTNFRWDMSIEAIYYYFESPLFMGFIDYCLKIINSSHYFDLSYFHSIIIKIHLINHLSYHFMISFDLLIEIN